MWEVLSEQSPFFNNKNDQELALNVANWIRPKILSGTPSIFKKLLEECWDANPDKRPDIRALWEKIEDINKSIHENNDYWKDVHIDINSNNTEMIYSNSKVHTFKDLSKPRNATEGNYLVFYYFILTEEQKGNYQIKYDILRILYTIS
jgi:hypothetical protein